MHKYLSTGQMAKYLGISKDFLLKNQGILFIKGKHYFMPDGINKYLWEVSVMEKWARGENTIDNPFKGVLDELC